MTQPHRPYIMEARAIIRLGIPLACSQIAYMLMITSDTIMLGWYGIPELAAITIAGAYFHMLYIVAAGFAWAITPLVARAYEQRNRRQLRRSTRMGLWLSVSTAMILQIPMWFSGDILIFLNQDPQTAHLSQDYLRIAGASLIPAMAVLVMRNYLSALERTNITLIASVIAVGANIACNYLLIFGNFGLPELGIIGAAIASLANNVLMLVILIWYAKRHFPKHRLFMRFWRIDRGAFGAVFRLGWPISLTHLFEATLFSASAIMMGWIGLYVLAAHGVAIQLASIVFMFHMGISQAASVRVGQAAGRQSLHDVRITGYVSSGVCVCFSLITAMIFVIYPTVLLGLFLDPQDPQRDIILSLGTSLLIVAAIFQLVDSAQVLGLNLLRGLEDTRTPMIYAGISYWVIGLPSSYLLGFVFNLSGVGIWLGLVIGLLCASILIMGRFWFSLKRINFKT